MAYLYFQYTLETYSEGRSTGYVDVPYTGGVVDGPEHGAAPPPWDIPCQADNLFVNQVKKLEVPHTATLKVNNVHLLSDTEHSP